MDLWIIAALAVFLLQTYATASLGLTQNGFAAYVGPRDALAAPGMVQARAQRALANMRENMIVFLPLALLVVFREPHMSTGSQSLATLGAEMFVVARPAYALAYVWGVPWVRSIVFGVGLTGMGLMTWALL